jgi:DNA-binding transcriptional ArsR family regulator
MPPRRWSSAGATQTGAHGCAAGGMGVNISNSSTRLAILSRLARGDATVTELAQPFDMSMPAITKHLKVLENAGLVSCAREAQTRPCRIEPQGLEQVANWVDGLLR